MDCYVYIQGHSREEGSKIAHQVAQILDGYFTGEIKHGYNPETLKVFFYRTYPANLTAKLLAQVEKVAQDSSKSPLMVTLEIP